MRLAALALAWSAGCFAQAPAQIPKVFVAEIQPGLNGHSLQLDGDTLIYTVRFGAETETKKITPPPERWAAFRRELDRQKVWRWKPDYKPGGKAGASASWRVKIEFADRSLTSAGYGAFPTRSKDHALPRFPFTRFRLALQDLLGQPFERPVKPIEVFDVTELKLVGTHPAADEAEQWADFRDPGGKVHRAMVRGPAGAFSTLKSVGPASVAVTVLRKGVAQEHVLPLKK